MKTWQGKKSFGENAKEEPEITSRLSAAEIDRLCSDEPHFLHVNETRSPSVARRPRRFEEVGVRKSRKASVR
jgi:hypothetical protein